MNLEETILRAVGKVLESGAIEAWIEKQLEGTIKEAISSELRGYSDFGKQLQAAVKESLGQIGNLDLPSYNDTILKIVRAKTEGLTRDIAQKQVAEQLEKLLTPAPEEITLSELVSEYQAFVAARRHCRCGDKNEISLHVEADGGDGFRYVNLDEEADKSKHACAIGIGTHYGKVYTLMLNHVPNERELFSGPFYGFEKMLFDMKVAGSKIVFDCDPETIDLSLEDMV